MSNFRVPYRQRGAAAVEFALVAGVGGFLLLLIGIMELSRVMFMLNTASEATRLGARIAVVCNINAPVIRTRMTQMLNIPDPDTNIVVQYEPPGCVTNSCRFVTVSISPNAIIDTVIPFVPFSINMPPFTTTLPRESLNSTNNPICT